jgi:hypothetical protein
MGYQVIARGDVKAAAVAAKFSAVPVDQWPDSSHEELQQLYAKATSPYVESAPAGVVSDPLALYKQDVRALLQRKGATKEEAVRLFADAPDASTGQEFVPALRRCYARILLELGSEDAKADMKSSLWFVAGMAQQHILQVASPHLRPLLMGPIMPEEAILRYVRSQPTLPGLTSM